MVGRCFYYDTPPNGKHLFVVLAPSLEQRGSFVCVNITTKEDGADYCDTTCELFAGEHPNLTSPVSVAAYAYARELPLKLIERLCSEQQLQDMPGPILSRIQTAPLFATSRLRKGYKKSIEAHIRHT